jgi:hypothetical protein
MFVALTFISKPMLRVVSVNMNVSLLRLFIGRRLLHKFKLNAARPNVS